MNDQQRIAAVVRQFQIDGELSGVVPYGSGHINDTYCVVFDRSGVSTRSIVQRINTTIFRNPAALMENIQRVTSHLAAKLAGEPDSALLTDWLAGFHREVGGIGQENLAAAVRDRLSFDGFTLWEKAGTPVALAGMSRIVAGMARVGPVFTPPGSLCRACLS